MLLKDISIPLGNVSNIRTTPVTFLKGIYILVENISIIKITPVIFLKDIFIQLGNISILKMIPLMFLKDIFMTEIVPIRFMENVSSLLEDISVMGTPLFVSICYFSAISRSYFWIHECVFLYCQGVI